MVYGMSSVPCKHPLNVVPIPWSPHVMFRTGGDNGVPPQHLLRCHLAAVGFQLREHNAVAYEYEVRESCAVGGDGGDPPTGLCLR